MADDTTRPFIDPATGHWLPRTGPDPIYAPAPEPLPRKTLTQWQEEYDFETNPHPWIHYVKSIPMGDNGETPMNHSVEVLNNIAIHLQRLGFKEPDPADTEIHFQPPLDGPDAVFNPGRWVDIDTPITPRPPEPTLDLTGVPEDQLDILISAATAEKARQARVNGADLDALNHARAAVTRMDATVILEPQE